MSDKLMVTPAGSASLMERLRTDGVLLESPCNGKGLCGKCKVRILSGEVSAPTESERKLLSSSELEGGLRLACMAVPLETVTLDPLDLLGSRRSSVLLDGNLPDFSFVPEITAKTVQPVLPGFDNTGSLCGAWSDRPDTPGFIPLYLVQKIPDLVSREHMTAVYRHGDLIDLREDSCLLGAAVDIGTTTVAVSLFDLRTGRKLGEDGFINPQKAFGLDVLSRIHYDIEHPGGVKELQAAIVHGLEDCIRSLIASIGYPADALYEIVAAGNATMLHCLLGVPLGSLGRAPYSSVFVQPMAVPAPELGFSFGLPVQVYCLPSVSTYIGGDIVAGALSARLDAAEDTVLFIDIGTNGEIILTHRGQMYACSCAAGPALEGMNISCGMRAEPGAIDHVSLQNGQVRFSSISGRPPCGICGSGLLEAVSQSVQQGIIGKNGRIAPDSPLTGTDDQGKRRIILDQDRNIYLTQSDIRQVQLCKGAILSGILTLLQQLSITPEEIDRVLVAGQFGRHLAPESLTGAGIIPAALLHRIAYIGNSSMTGAQLCLLSGEERLRAWKIAREISYIELSVTPGYEKCFTQCLQFREG